jgi:hypothetical protein
MPRGFVRFAQKQTNTTLRYVCFVPTTDSCTAANDPPFDYVVGAGVNDPPPARSKAVIRPSLTPSLPADH